MAALVRLISWDEDDAKRRAAELTAAGLQVRAEPLKTAGLVAQFASISAVCIDLDRLPSHGREIAVALRNTKATRYIPIVFAGGPRDKVARIKRDLPDAIYAEWPKVPGTLQKALRRRAPASPVTPPSHMERYAATNLCKKLGIAEGMKVTLLAAPEGFTDTLSDMPEGVEFQRRMSPAAKLTLWFVRSRADLERDLEFVAATLGPGAALWIIYPKKSGSRKSDLGQNEMREAALAAGLVDYKICAVDADWTGLKFARKK